MGYYYNSGVVFGVRFSEHDLPDDEDIHDVKDKLEEAGLYVYIYTDTNIWFVAVGKEMVSMEEDEIRGVKIDDPHFNEYDRLAADLSKILPKELVEKNLGIWFIQGGS